MGKRKSIINERNYPWVIVATLSVCCIIWSGAGYFAFSIFVKPLQSEFGWDRSTIMSSFMLWSLTVGVSSIFAGKAVDKYRPRKVILVGSVITGLGFMCLSLIQSPLHLYLSYIVVGMGISAIGQVPSTALVSEWFEEKRGLALGIMSTGVGLGGLIISPLTGGVLIPFLGWRLAYLSLGILSCVVMIPLSIFVIRSKNDPGSLKNDDERVGADTDTDEEIHGKDNRLKQALSSSLLWLIAVSFLLSQFGATGTLQSQVPHLDDMGFPATTAASILGFVGLVSSFAKFFFGWLCDFIRAKHAFILGVLFQATGSLILLNITPSSHGSFLWFYAIAMGMGAGSWLPIMSMSVSRNFSIKTYGTLFGIVNFALSIGVATGPLFAGYIYDAAGSYRQAFHAFMGIYVLAVIAALLGRANKNAYVKAKR